ncbi:hypothetical protein [Microbacterium sp. 77mftsu3.1]|uniref:hypothetical protein n=1 Tax=Microbacterium sp. 77mftsu3.1 TaxID=1761802 RepID=UPI000364165C|nr:hypothetical protein [Microbacterium sp. 77mftsu3.1]SDH36756.1 hypothetical protein SAMN04488590_3147 [Microbacterium sp. 77mftsu3.1]
MTLEAQWELLLDQFESELARSEPSEGGWLIPEGPVPPALAERAENVLQRFQARIREVASEMEQTRAHLDALDRVPQGGLDVPRYVEIDG